MAPRTAHPYADTDVIDARAPRFNQATIGVVSAVALLTGWWWLLALLALQLVLGLRFGRRYCLPCVFYFEVVQPRIGEGPVEDARPPRFANVVGAAFLSAATLAYLAGLAAVGAVLGLAELGAGAVDETVVQFTHPLCSDCRDLEERLRDGTRPLVTVDVSRRPELARRYHVAGVPTAFSVAADGTVLERLA